MADITKCKGIGCPIKDDCYRYTAKDSGFMQSWFLDNNVGEKTKKSFKSEYYWGDNAQRIWNELSNIMKK